MLQQIIAICVQLEQPVTVTLQLTCSLSALFVEYSVCYFLAGNVHVGRP